MLKCNEISVNVGMLYYWGVGIDGVVEGIDGVGEGVGRIQIQLWGWTRFGVYLQNHLMAVVNNCRYLVFCTLEKRNGASNKANSACNGT